MVQLKDIVQHLTLSLPAKWAALPVSGVTHDSRKVKPGFLFVAVKGFKSDGHRYLPQAQQRGAVAALVQKKDTTLSLPQLVVPDTRLALALSASAFYSQALRKIKLVGVTGTNGKTTVSHLIQAIIQESGKKAGLLGTISYRYGNREQAAWNTTPEAPDLCAMLNEMVALGISHAVLEVSSHALALQRVAGLTFASAIFTNLSRDHLDFHSSMEDYFKAKARLFTLLEPTGSAVINMDDPYGQKLYHLIDHPTLTYGAQWEADVRILAYNTTLKGTDMKLNTPLGEMQLFTPLIGLFNVFNVAAAVAAGVGLGFSLDTIRQGLEKSDQVTGRLQSIVLPSRGTVFIDYAHTPDALEKVLKTLKSLPHSRLWVLFGAGGDRDTGKRPLMGRVAEQLADRVIVTSDNPRSEDPEKIIQDILSGMEGRPYAVEPDRKEAIKKAVQQLSQDDILLIAGKGHEQYQEIKGVKYPFDELALIKEAAGA